MWRPAPSALRAARLIPLVAATALAAARADCPCGTLADEFRAADAGLVREWIVQAPFDSGASRLECVVVGEGLVVAQSGDGGLHAIRSGFRRTGGPPAGTVAWSRTIAEATGHAWPPTIGSRLVVVASELAVHAVDRETGTLEWERPAGADTAAAAVQSAEWVYAPLSTSQLLRLPVNPLAGPAAAPPVPTVAGPSSTKRERGSNPEPPTAAPESLDPVLISAGGRFGSTPRPFPGGVVWTTGNGPVVVARTAVDWGRYQMKDSGRPIVGRHFALSQAARIVVASANRDVLDAADETLAAAGYRVECAGSGGEVLAAAARQAPDLVVLDAALDGAVPDLCGRLLAAGAPTRDAPIVVLVPARGENAQQVTAELKQLAEERLKRDADDLFRVIPHPFATVRPGAGSGERPRPTPEQQRGVGDFQAALAAGVQDHLRHRGMMYIATAAGSLSRMDLVNRGGSAQVRAAWSVALPDRAAAEPLVAGDAVVVSLGPAGIVACSVADGRELWRNDLVGTLVAAAGGSVWMLDEVGRLTALDVATGARRHSCAAGCFTLPVVSNVQDRLVLASPGGLVVSLAPRTPRRAVTAGARPAGAPAPRGPAASPR